MKKNVIFLTLIGVAVLLFNVNYNNLKNYLNKKSNLVIINELKDEYNENTLAIMVQQDDGSYKRAYSFPQDYSLGKVTCGSESNKTDRSDVAANFKYEDNKLSSTINSTVYCYLYFDQKPKTPNLRSLCGSSQMGSCIPSKSTSEIEVIPNINCNQGGMCRYQGTSSVVDNNWICFGTSDSSKCKSGSDRNDKYLYRIIGVTPTGQIKVIKKEALNQGYTWADSVNQNSSWPSSYLYNQINGSTFLTNTNYVPSGWQNKIDNYDWYYGHMYITHSRASASSLYDAEHGLRQISWFNTPGCAGSYCESWGYWNNTVKAKIGLMYIHDYYYSGTKNGYECSDRKVMNTTENTSNCKNSWIYLWNSQNDSNAPSKDMERIMTHFGYVEAAESNSYMIRSNSAIDITGDYCVYGAGYSCSTDSTKGSVRPVFYLTSSISLKSGTGTLDDPYVISE